MAVVESWKKAERNSRPGLNPLPPVRLKLLRIAQCARPSIFMSGREASHSVQGPVSSWVAERLHTMCKAQYLHEWQRGFTQCARPTIFMSGREASHSFKNACGGLSELEILGGPFRKVGSLRLPQTLCTCVKKYSWGKNAWHLQLAPLVIN